LSKNGRSAAHLSIAGKFEGLLDAGAEAASLDIWSNTSVQTVSIISENFILSGNKCPQPTEGVICAHEKKL